MERISAAQPCAATNQPALLRASHERQLERAIRLVIEMLPHARGKDGRLDKARHEHYANGVDCTRASTPANSRCGLTLWHSAAGRSTVSRNAGLGSVRRVLKDASEFDSKSDCTDAGQFHSTVHELVGCLDMAELSGGAGRMKAGVCFRCSRAELP